MRKCSFALALVLLAAACQGEPPPTSSTTVLPPTPPTSRLSTSTTLAAFSPGATLLYTYESGEEIVYRYSAAVDMETSFLPGPDAEGMPGSMEMGFLLSGPTTYLVDDGPAPGTVRVTLRQTVEDLSVSKAAVDGQPLGQEVGEQMAAAFAANGYGTLPEVSVVLDEQGNVLSMQLDGEEVPVSLLGGDPLSSNPLQGVSGLDAYLGPAFPDHAVAVGDSWTTEDTQEIPFYGSELTVTTDNRVVGEEIIRSHHALVIEATSDTSALQIDYAELFENLARTDPQELRAMGFTEQDFVELEEMRSADLQFQMAVEPSVSHSTTWFDLEEGLMIRNVGSGTTVLVMELALPAEAGGSLSISMRLGFDTSMELEERLSAV